MRRSSLLTETVATCDECERPNQLTDVRHATCSEEQACRQLTNLSKLHSRDVHVCTRCECGEMIIQHSLGCNAAKQGDLVSWSIAESVARIRNLVVPVASNRLLLLGFSGSICWTPLQTWWMSSIAPAWRR